MKTLFSIVVAGVAIASAAFGHEGHDHATGVVKERMIAMTRMGESLLVISKRLRTNNQLETIAADARLIRDLAGKLTKQFPPGSTQYPTAAKPSIWQDWAAFEINARRLELEAARLMTAKAEDSAELRTQFLIVAQVCDECHETFRIPKRK